MESPGLGRLGRETEAERRRSLRRETGGAGRGMELKLWMLSEK